MFKITNTHKRVISKILEANPKELSDGELLVAFKGSVAPVVCLRVAKELINNGMNKDNMRVFLNIDSIIDVNKGGL